MQSTNLLPIAIGTEICNLSLSGYRLLPRQALSAICNPSHPIQPLLKFLHPLPGNDNFLILKAINPQLQSAI
jgi:hypothetical protein